MNKKLLFEVTSFISEQKIPYYSSDMFGSNMEIHQTHRAFAKDDSVAGEIYRKTFESSMDSSGEPTKAHGDAMSALEDFAKRNAWFKIPKPTKRVGF